MRIGQFGEAYNLSLDTIRHYMDLGLIVPERRGGQYFFDERCRHELELVLEFKGMGFSLNEIKSILFYKNLGKFMDFIEDSYYQALYSDKYKRIDQEIANLTEIRDRLKTKLDELSARTEKSAHKTGIDLKVLELLHCPKCRIQLLLQDGAIHRNQVMEGKLSCGCGEQYRIESGILIAGKPATPPVERQLDDHIQEYIHATDPGYLENLYKGLEWSKRKLGQYDLRNKVLLELGSGFGFFLRNVYEELPDDSLYIAVDRSLERQRFLKSALEKAGSRTPKKLLYICADFTDVPLMHRSVDLVIDHSGSSNYGFEHETFLLREVDHLVKKDAALLASFIAFKNFSVRSKIEARLRNNFISDKIRESIAGLNYTPLDEKISPLVDKGGTYENFFVPGEEIYFYACFAKR